jgi:hypothetical protein
MIIKSVSWKCVSHLLINSPLCIIIYCIECKQTKQSNTCWFKSMNAYTMYTNKHFKMNKKLWSDYWIHKHQHSLAFDRIYMWYIFLQRQPDLTIYSQLSLQRGIRFTSIFSKWQKFDCNKSAHINFAWYNIFVLQNSWPLFLTKEYIILFEDEFRILKCWLIKYSLWEIFRSAGVCVLFLFLAVTDSNWSTVIFSPL